MINRLREKKKHFEHNSLNDLKKQFVNNKVGPTPAGVPGGRSAACPPLSQRLARQGPGLQVGHLVCVRVSQVLHSLSS